MTKEDFDAEVYEYAKSRIDTKDSRMTDRMLAYRAGAEPREKRIEELKSELIKKADTNHSLVEQMADLESKNANQKDQLTKAREIIKNLFILKNDHYGNTKMEWRVEVIEQAEQFIKGGNIILEDAQVGNSPFDADEVFNKEMKAYLEEK